MQGTIGAKGHENADGARRQVKAVKPAFVDNLYVGTNYQLQVSGDLLTWTNSGSSFTATNSTLVYPQYWDVANWDDLFFRLQTVP